MNYLYFLQIFVAKTAIQGKILTDFAQVLLGHRFNIRLADLFQFFNHPKTMQSSLFNKETTIFFIIFNLKNTCRIK